MDHKPRVGREESDEPLADGASSTKNAYFYVARVVYHGGMLRVTICRRRRGRRTVTRRSKTIKPTRDSDKIEPQVPCQISAIALGIRKVRRLRWMEIQELFFVITKSQTFNRVICHH